MDETSPEERRRARAHWPVRVFPLGAEPGDDLSETTTPEERLAMMWPLALDAWASAGLEIPDYPRSQAPGRVFYDLDDPEFVSG